MIRGFLWEIRHRSNDYKTVTSAERVTHPTKPETFPFQLKTSWRNEKEAAFDAGHQFKSLHLLPVDSNNTEMSMLTSQAVKSSMTSRRASVLRLTVEVTVLTTTTPGYSAPDINRQNFRVSCCNIQSSITKLRGTSIVNFSYFWRRDRKSVV